MADITWGADDSLEWTITYWPGVQDYYHYVMPFSISSNAPVYPSHQVLSDGRHLADVSANEWATLPEIAERPLGFGPFAVDICKEEEPLFEEKSDDHAVACHLVDSAKGGGIPVWRSTEALLRQRKPSIFQYVVKLRSQRNQITKNNSAIFNVPYGCSTL